MLPGCGLNHAHQHERNMTGMSIIRDFRNAVKSGDPWEMLESVGLYGPAFYNADQNGRKKNITMKNTIMTMVPATNTTMSMTNISMVSIATTLAAVQPRPRRTPSP